MWLSLHSFPARPAGKGVSANHHVLLPGGPARRTGAETLVHYQDAKGTVAPVKCQKVCQGKHGKGWGGGWE